MANITTVQENDVNLYFATNLIVKSIQEATKLRGTVLMLQYEKDYINSTTSWKRDQQPEKSTQV